MKKTLALALAAVTLSACAGGYAGENYQPVADVQASAAKKGIPEMEAHQQYRIDLAYCKSLAEQRSVITAGGQQGAVGAVIGAGTGALAGVLRGGGSVAVGAGLGALAGGGGALAHGAIAGNRAKQDITITCLRNRGWDVLAR